MGSVQIVVALRWVVDVIELLRFFYMNVLCKISGQGVHGRREDKALEALAYSALRIGAKASEGILT
jgi:hypothetical protein